MKNNEKMSAPLLVELLSDKQQRDYEELLSLYGEGDAQTASAKLQLIRNVLRYDAERACELAKESYAACKTTLGIGHKLTEEMFCQINNAYYDLKQYDKLVELHEERVAALTVALGADHITTLKNMHALAACYGLVGDAKSCSRTYRKTLKAKTKALGEGHPSTLYTQIKVILRENDPGKNGGYDLKFYKKMEKPRALLGGVFEYDDHDAVEALYVFAESVKETEGIEDIGAWAYEDIYKWLKEHNGDSTEFRRALANLEYQYRADGMYEEMLGAMKEYYELYVNDFGIYDERSLELLDELTYAYIRTDNTLQSNLEYCRKEYGEYTTLSPEEQEAKYDDYHPKDHSAQAIACAEKKYQLAVEMYGADSPNTTAAAAHLDDIRTKVKKTV